MYQTPLPGPGPAPNRRLLIAIALVGGLLWLLVVGGGAAIWIAFYWSRSDLERATRADEFKHTVTDGTADARGSVDKRAPIGRSEGGPDAEPRPDPAYQVVAQRFLEHVRAGELDAAYALGSRRFQQSVTRQAFGELVERHADFKSGQLMSYGRVFPEKGRDETVRLKYVSRITRIRTQLYLTLTEEDNAWRVDKLEIQEDRVTPGNS
jgi:hypothetical protein